MLTKQERYISAAAYLFDAGYLLSAFVKKESSFITFHFHQANRFILFFLLPGFLLLLVGLYLNTFFLVVPGVLSLLTYLVLSIIAGASALQGKMKKIL